MSPRRTVILAALGLTALGLAPLWAGRETGASPAPNVEQAAPAPAAAALVAAPLKESKQLEELTGADWTRLSVSEKQRFVYTAIGGLERQGVFITRSPQEYLEAIEKILQADTSFKQEYLDNIFVFCVYDGEPQAREAIDRIRKGSAQGA